MKIRNKEDKINYQNLTLVNREKTQYQGREYTLHRYAKDYSFSERINKLKQAILPTLFSLGLVLVFSAAYRRQWGKVLFGHITKEILFPKNIIRKHVVPCDVQALKAVDQTKAAQFQAQLDERKIPLNCESPAELKNKNAILRDEVDIYLADVKQRHPEYYEVVKKLFDSVDILTFDELKAGLQAGCEKLNELLGDQKYSIGFVKHKSQAWLAELALPYLNQAPSSFFINATDTLENIRGEQSAINKQERHFVVFDDAAYSGKQIRYLIDELKKALAKTHQNEPCHLYLVVPFLSSIAEQRLETYINKVRDGFDPALKNEPTGNLQVHLITTNRKVKAMLDVFTRDQIVQLNNFAEIENLPGHSICYFTDGQATKCLTLTEWKIPDDASVPIAIKMYKDTEKKKFISFTTDFLPPYKTAPKIEGQ